MRQSVKHIASVFLISLFLIGNSGIIIFNHYCAHSNKNSIGIISEVGCDSSDYKKIENCCRKENHIQKCNDEVKIHSENLTFKNSILLPDKCCSNNSASVKLDYFALKNDINKNFRIAIPLISVIKQKITDIRDNTKNINQTFQQQFIETPSNKLITLIRILSSPKRAEVPLNIIL